MALSYYFSFKAKAETPSATLEHFLRQVESSAKTMGFGPTLVLKAMFDTDERIDFARRLTSGLPVEDSRLSGTVTPAKGQLWSHDHVHGSGRVIPKQAIVLVLTDASSTEVCLGFFRYPHLIVDVGGKPIAETGVSGDWIQRDFLDTPDPRYRKLIRMFADAGFLESEHDEYV